MQVGDVVERVAAVVHLVFQVERLGEMRGLDQGGDAALDRDVAAQEVGGALKNPGRVTVEPGLRVLGRHQRDVELLAQLDAVVDVLVGERVLVPVEAEVLDSAPDAQRHLVIVRPNRIEHQRVVVAGGAPHRLAHLDVLAPILRRMDLVRGPAGGFELADLLDVGRRAFVHLRAGVGRHAQAIRTDELMDRHVGGLAGDVPQRDVHRPDRAHRGGAAALPHGLIEPLARERVLAHEDRLEILDEPRPVVRCGMIGRAEKGVAVDALIGLDGQEPELAPAAEPSGVRGIAGRRDVVPGEQGERHVGDFHGPSRCCRAQ